MSGASLSIPVAILAGGLATRLRPLTERIPKSLLQVAGKPFLSHQLALLRRQGIEDAVLCVGHLGDMIREQFGEGERWGIRLRYAYDGPKLLGTGGALKQALPLLGPEFFVLYGDSYLPVEFRPIAEAFRRSGRLGLMTVYRNTNRFDTSNVWFVDGEIRVYDKTRRLPAMEHIDYGLSLFSAAAFASWEGQVQFDLSEVHRQLLAARQLAAFEVAERFYEIGSPAGLMELEALLSRQQRPGS